MPQILLKNGTALIHDDKENVNAVKADILIVDNKISKIEKDISAPQDAEVVDCTDKIISPGFIDTHHHVWQTQLKGRHADHTLIQYMPSGNCMSGVYTPEDAFWGQLGGCLEMLHAGTTTVADYAHINTTPAHNDSAISATVTSGIRSIYGYSPNVRMKSMNPFTIGPNGIAGHSLSTFETLAKQAPWGNGRVTLGFAFDGFPFVPKDCAEMVMQKCNEYSIDLIQMHVSWKPGKPSFPQLVEQHGILDSRFLMAHSFMSPEDAELYVKRGVHYSSTPSTELQMSMCLPVVAFDDQLGVRELGSLGVDCHSNNPAFMPGEARIGLQSARAYRGKLVEPKGQTPKTVGPTVQEAFNLCTILGARAVKQSDKIGSIAVGKLADLVIFDSNSPAMICGAQHDPLATIILNSSPADVDTVIVDGMIRKRDGKLLDVQVGDEVGKKFAGKEALQWRDVVGELLRTRERLQSIAEKVDYADGEKKIMELWHMTEAELVDV